MSDTSLKPDYWNPGEKERGVEYTISTLQGNGSHSFEATQKQRNVQMVDGCIIPGKKIHAAQLPRRSDEDLQVASYTPTKLVLEGTEPAILFPCGPFNYLGGELFGAWDNVSL